MDKFVEPLIPLQELDLEIHELRADCEAKPGELASSDEKRAYARGNLETLQAEIKALKLEGSKREKDIAGFDEKIQKLTAQSNQAKKNAEYHTLLKEISGNKADRGRVEDGLLDIYMQIDEKVKLEKIRAEDVEVAEKDFGEAKKRTGEEIADLGRRLEELLNRRKADTGSIDAELLKLYDRILGAKRDGLALASVEAHEVLGESGKESFHSCQGCNIDLMPQEVNQLLLGREVVFCRSCSRILYIRS